MYEDGRLCERGVDVPVKRTGRLPASHYTPGIRFVCAHLQPIVLQQTPPQFQLLLQFFTTLTNTISSTKSILYGASFVTSSTSTSTRRLNR
ncbi:hypothetical protein Pcinc_019217 [Petrolisthes cinctipes]|uniref:Uncharacterized protein n=1 Tax=Petrolisthes cinctipes TaxID=88211 RepID=A0AAE1FLU9_PETCI|nr:hypothetical protein Pcinc_019217 [Petrolisthes cinctipes]